MRYRIAAVLLWLHTAIFSTLRRLDAWSRGLIRDLDADAIFYDEDPGDWMKDIPWPP